MSGTAATAAAPPQWWQRVADLFRSNGKPILWRVALAVAVGFVAGHRLALVLGFERRSIGVGLVAACVAAVGSMGHLRQAMWLAGWAAVVVGLVVVIAADTTGYPLAAAIGMALVAFWESLATAAKPVGYVLGVVGGYAYLVTAALGVISVDIADVDLGRSVLISLLGAAAGLCVVAVWAFVVDWRTGALHDRSPLPPSPWPPMWRSLRKFDACAKDGVRRAVGLGIAMYLFQAMGTRDAFWILFAAFAVLLPNGRSTLGKAIVRAGGTLAGCAVLAGVALLFPHEISSVIAVVCLLVAIAYAQRSSALCAAWMGAGCAILAGVAAGQVPFWAGRRVIDTVLGVGIALVLGYLPWPGDKPSLRPPPDLGS